MSEAASQSNNSNTEPLSPAKRELLRRWTQGQAISQTQTITRRTSTAAPPLSLAQERQLFLELLNPGTAINNLSIGIDIRGVTCLEDIQSCLHIISQRHEVFRTSFPILEGFPVCSISDSVDIAVGLTDLTGCKQDVARQQMLHEAMTVAQIPFDLATAPLARAHAFRMTVSQWTLIIVVHHVIADGWSLGVFVREFMECLTARRQGNIPKLPTLALQYSDYAERQRQNIQNASMLRSEAFWKQTLDGELPLLDIPTDYPRSSHQSFRGGSVQFTVSRSVADALQEISRRQDATLFMTLISVWAVLLHRVCAQDDIIIGTPLANRPHDETHPLIGVFINSIALRSQLHGNMPFTEFLSAMKHRCVEAYKHQDLPFERLVSVVHPARDVSRNPIFQTVFNLQNVPIPELKSNDIELQTFEIDRGVSQFDVSCMVRDSDDGLGGTIEYSAEVFSPERMISLSQQFVSLLEQISSNENTMVADLQLCTADERTFALTSWNNTTRQLAMGRRVDQLIEEVALKYPDDIAVADLHDSVSYSRVMREVNLVARQLQSRVRAGRVAVMMQRTVTLPIALLAIIRSGNSFIPLDSQYPADRIRMIVEDADVDLVLTDSDADVEGAEACAQINVHTLLRVDGHDGHIGTYKGGDADLPPALVHQADVPAYIIYTSGSTGRPKGVSISHNALCNLLLSMQRTPGITSSDRWLAVTSIGFDISLLELFGPLVSGACVVVAPSTAVSRPDVLVELLHSQNISIVQATPTTWSMMIEYGWSGSKTIRVLSGGEALSPTLARKLVKRVGELWNMYGPTETTVWSSVARVVPGFDRISIGHPIDNTRFYILDRFNQPVAPGCYGELYIGGLGIADGYLNNDRLWNERCTLDPFVDHHLSGSKMFRTGDRARYTREGQIELSGRFDFQLKINGYRIEPDEIAEQIRQCQGVHDAVVLLQQTAQDNIFGHQILVAYYTVDDPSPSVSDIRSHLAKRLPSAMVPQHFVVIASMPRLSSGKIDRSSREFSFREDTMSTPAEARSDAERTLVAIWQQVLGRHGIGIHDSFFDLGGASLQIVQVIAHARQAGIFITIESVFEHETIAAILESLTSANQRPDEETALLNT